MSALGGTIGANDRPQPASGPALPRPPLPHDEGGRLAALRATRILDSGRDPAYEAFVELAAAICEAPMAQINFIDADRQYTKAQTGIDAPDISRGLALCAHTVAGSGLLEIEDARLDDRFRESPFVLGEPNIRFYAGVPLVDRDGHAIGSVCAIDRRPRLLDDRQREALRRLATSIASLVDSRRDVAPEMLGRLSLVNAALEHAGEPAAILRLQLVSPVPTIAYVNRAFTELFGYEPGEIIGETTRTLFGERTSPETAARMRARVLAGEPICEVIRLYTRACDDRLVEVRDRPIDVDHRIATFRDLTEIDAAQTALAAANERLASFVTANDDAILTFDELGSCVAVNDATLRTFGYAAGDLLGDGHRRLADPGGLLEATPLQQPLAGGEPGDFAIRSRHADGRAIYLECKAIPIRVGDRRDGAYVVCKNVTEETRLNEVVRVQAARTHALCLIAAKTEADGSAIDAALGLVLDTVRMEYGYVGRLDGDELEIVSVVGEPVLERGHRFALGDTLVRKAIASRDVIVAEDMAATGRTAFADWRGYIAAPLIVGGEPYGAVGFAARRTIAFDGNDVDFMRLVASFVATALERRLKDARLDRLAFYDTLTELANRAKFMRDLAAAISFGNRHRSKFAVHCIDLDDFKSVNDRGGHSAGDRALAEVAARLRVACRMHDVPARLGGDEFVVLQPAIERPGEARALAERIVALLSRPFELGDERFDLGASVGVAIFPATGTDPSSLLHAADVALYRAKAAGKGRVVVSDGS